MYQDQKLWIGKAGDEKLCLYPKMANRHGLIAGATGTGKTVTLKVLAESFSDCGVPVFLADAKGDLAGMFQAGELQGSVAERAEAMGLTEEGFTCRSYPTVFWDVFAKGGMPLRTTVSEMGPLLLAQILDLNETQSDILTVIFKIADDEQLLLIDTKDLRAMLQYVSEHAKEYSAMYGNMAKQSLAAITRAVVALEAAGGEQFFGEPALDIRDWLRTEADGRGVIELLDCRELMTNPTMYAMFLLWLLSELYETLPEVGDMDRPKLVFFFDEAHMLFRNASKSLLQKVEQVVRLIRSKGVGIYFITQSPGDIPSGILGQLGNKFQHALHAYTPAEQKAIRACADAFRANPDFDTREVLENLGVGEALVSVLDEDGIPTVVKRAAILPPQSRMGAVSDEDREQQIKSCLLYSKYADFYDRDSAYEFLLRQSTQEAALAQRAAEEANRAKAAEKEAKERAREEARAEKERQEQAEREEKERQKEAEREERERQKKAEREERERQKELEREERERQRELEREEKERQREAERAEKERLKAEERARREQEALLRKQKATIGRVANTAAGTIGRELGNEFGKKLGGSFGKRLGGNVGASLGRGILSTLLKL